MSRSTRRHESKSRTAKRGPKNPVEPDAPKARLKSTKQRRSNERAALRREYR